MRRRENGAAAALVAMMLPFVIGGFGLAIDGGHAFDAKRRLQKIADGAALTAAFELRRGNAKDYLDIVMRDARKNGFRDDFDTISILSPPDAGRYAGRAGYIEVRVRGKSPSYFTRMFGRKNVPVEAMAVAAVVPADKCVHVLNPHAKKALWASGRARMELQACGIHVNSDHLQAARTDGGAQVIAPTIGIVGDYSGNGFSPTPLTGMAAESDPFGDLEPPSFKQCTYSKTVTVKSVKTLHPGVYCGGISINAKGHALLKPGTYVLNGGGLKVNGTGKITGVDVMFYNTGESKGKHKNTYAPIVFSGKSLAQLSAPRTGRYAGILFFQDRTITSTKPNKLAGGAKMLLKGALYFPTTPLRLTGSAGMTVQRVRIIADQLRLAGNIAIQAPDVASGLTSPYLQRATLVN